MSEKYSFVFSGSIEEGAREEEVKGRLAQGFGLSPEKIDRIFTGKPVVIKRGVDRETAERFRQKFAAAGALGEIKPEIEAPDVPAAPPESPVALRTPRPPAITPKVTATTPGGFWRRSFAFILDGFLMAIPGWLIGLAFYDQLVRLGQSGRLIGFVIALCYFGVMNSSLGKGQTLGKRLMKIRVVDLQGDYIPLWRSVLRYFVLGLPFFCNHLQVDAQSPLIGIPLALIVFGLGGSIFYFYIFNRRNRRSVHDFAAGTLVVVAEPRNVPQFQPAWRGHFAILAVIMLALGATGAVMIPRLKQSEPFAELLAVQASLQQEAGIHSVSVHNGFTTMGDNTTNWFALNIVVAEPNLNFEETADRFARLVLRPGSSVDDKDLLVVNVIRGYDIGIASGWSRESFSYPPYEWRARLDLL